MQTRSPRIARLKERLARLEHDRYREFRPLSIFEHGADPGEPVVVRKARGLALALRQMPIYIQDDELIVGGRTLYGGPDAPRMVTRPLTFTRVSQWSSFFYPTYLAPNEARRNGGEGPPGVPVTPHLQAREGSASAHAVPGFDRVLSLGFGGLREEALRSAERLRRETPPDLTRRLAFLEAAAISLTAAIDLVRRYSELARDLAATRSDAGRRGELELIAAVCDHVAEEPPRDFREALQLFLFTRLVAMVESLYCMPIGRFDQYLGPFLERDLASRRINKMGALELLQCLFVKLNEESDILSRDDCVHLVLSGQDRDGRDATNTLSYLSLEAAVELRLPSPKIGVRLHNGTPKEFLTHCIETMRLGIGGLPEICNDEAFIPALIAAGVPLHDARDYCIDGCQEVTLGGRSDFYPVWTRFRFLKCLEAFLKDGQDFATFLDLVGAFKEQITRELREAADDGNRRDAALAEISPAPFLSATLDGCLVRGLDKTWGGTTYNMTGMFAMELPSTANSLAAIKKFVYETRYLSLPELRRAMANDFADLERLRLLLLNRGPKYGNDEDYVDAIAVELASHFIETAKGFRNPRGGAFCPGLFDYGNYMWGAWEIGATPDGRKAGTFTTSNMSPVPGTDHNGPTACIESACKLMRLRPPMGATLDLKLHPITISGPGGLERLVALVRTFMDLGGMVLQVNVVDTATLRDAQREPEGHRDLLVRVWGFSAYFVELTPYFQEHIIARTEHVL